MPDILTQLSDPNKLGLEGMQAILDQHNIANPDKHPITLLDSPLIIDTCQQAIMAHKHGKEEQYQFVLAFHKVINGYHGIHYSAVNLNLKTDGTVEVLVLDAVGDATCFDLVSNLIEVKEINNIYLACCVEDVSSLQTDYVSCPVFSLSHAIEAQRMGANLFTHMNRPEVNPIRWALNLVGISWREMPPDITKYGQCQIEWDKYSANYQQQFNSPGNELEESNNYRAAMREQSVKINPANEKNVGNIIPGVFQSLAAPAIQNIKQNMIQNIQDARSTMANLRDEQDTSNYNVKRI